LLDDRYSEWITLRTPGGYVGRNKYDPNAQYPLTVSDFSTTFEALYPKRPNFNQYTECSSRGTCDYATGQCKCFDGFEGRGCRRTTCPNGCSGHGRCLDNSDINSQYSSWNYPNDQTWDMKRTQSCKCDRGFTGYDCNARTCPFGDDPTSDCGENSAGDVQLIVSRSSDTADKYFTLSFTDMFGGTFTTRPIKDKGCTKGNPCPEIQYALMDLPNAAIPEVEIDYVENVAGTGKSTSLYTVHFTHSSNAGKQNTLECDVVANSNVAGAQPNYPNVEACAVFNVGGPEWFDASGEAISLNLATNGFPEITTLQTKTLILTASNGATAATTYEDFQPCASKGDCDGSTGTCTCNSGHYGEACEMQSTYY